MFQAILAFFVAGGLVLALMPILSRLAMRFGLVDHPDNSRKLHRSAIPLIGGIAIFIGTFSVTPLVLYFFREGVKLRPTDFPELLGLAIAATVLMVVGVLDDRFGIRGRQKLVGQIIAATILIAFGYSFREVYFLGFHLQFGIFSAIVIYAWMVAATNSINLLDGADGFASTIGIVMSIALSAMLLYQGQVIDAVLVMAMCGSMLAFLKFNFPPAKAFLGDAGSMLIGFILGAIAIRCTFKQATVYAFMAPIALLAIPFIDTGAAIIRRRLTGRSIYEVDRGHLHHQLSKSGYGPRMSLLWVAALCSVTALGGVMSLVMQHSIYAFIAIVITCGILLLGRIFGGAEARLVSNRAVSIAKSFMKKSATAQGASSDSIAHVQGSRDWTSIWGEVCNFASDHYLKQITLDLNMPWLHESFHASRVFNKDKNGTEHEWTAAVPLLVDGRLFGRVEIVGPKESALDHHEVLANLIKMTSQVELELEQISKAEEQASLAGKQQSTETTEEFSEVSSPAKFETRPR